jgi:phage terminase large subunit-like protein
MFDGKKANHAIEFIQELKHTKSPFYGQPFDLLDWEFKIVRDVWGTVNNRGLRVIRYVYIEIPKKNGKSELCAAVALKQLFADGEINGEVYGCAAEKEQASIIFDVAVEMVDQDAALKKRTKLNLSKKRMTDKITGTYYQVLSAESYSKHGFNLSACVFDELHAQPSRGLYDVMTHGAGDARLQPLWFLITTAGDDPDRVSIGWEVHEKAINILNGKHPLKSWYPVIFNYEGDDIYNEKNWEIANPSLGHTIDIGKVREAADDAKVNPADERLFRQLRLNQWITTKLTSWLPLDLWDQTEGGWDRTEMLGEDCYLGGDFSSTTDLTGLCLIFPPQRKHKDWRICFDGWIPAETMQSRIREDHVPYDQWVGDAMLMQTDGETIDYTKIEEYILELKTLYKIQEFGSDKTFAMMLLQRLGKAGIQCVDIPQRVADLTDPMNEIERLMRSGELTHERNPAARWCYGNTQIFKNGNAQIKFVKEHRGASVVRTKRIDLMVACVNGMARAMFYKTKVDINQRVNDDEWGL